MQIFTRFTMTIRHSISITRTIITSITSSCILASSTRINTSNTISTIIIKSWITITSRESSASISFNFTTSTITRTCSTGCTLVITRLTSCISCLIKPIHTFTTLICRFSIILDNTSNAISSRSTG